MGPMSSVVSTPRCIVFSSINGPQCCVPGSTVSGLRVFPLRGYSEICGVLGCCRLSAGKSRDVHVGSIVIKTSVEG